MKCKANRVLKVEEGQSGGQGDERGSGGGDCL